MADVETAERKKTAACGRGAAVGRCGVWIVSVNDVVCLVF